MTRLLLKCVLLLSLAIAVQSAAIPESSKAERRAERRALQRSTDNQDMAPGERAPRADRRSQGGGFRSRRRRLSLRNLITPWRTPMGDFKVPGTSSFGRGMRKFVDRNFGGGLGFGRRQQRMAARGMGGNQRIPVNHMNFGSDVGVNSHLVGGHH